MLVYAQIRGGLDDLTTWEQMGFMQHGEVRNPYNRGKWMNLLQLFHMAKERQIDYTEKYEGEMFEFEPQELV